MGEFTEEKSTYFSVLAFISHIRDENLYYNGCPDCMRKVSEEENGWRCLNCNKFLQQCSVRYIPSIKMSDSTGSIYATAFGDISDDLIGYKAEEMKNFQMTNETYYRQVLKECCYKQKHFVVSARMKLSNQGEYRCRYTIYR